MNMRICWICNKNEADTMEHLHKKSLLKKHYFSRINPLYGNPFIMKIGQSMFRLKGPKDKAVQSEKVICAVCNNARTSAADKAFDKFYEWVLINQDARVINWEKIYGTEFNVQIINLVQYMKKLLGCLLIKYNHILLEEFSPLCEDISNFSISICITYPFRSLKNYKKSMAVGTIGFNDPKIIYSRTTNIIKKAVWDYHIGSFQITLWYNLKHNPKFGKIVKIDQSIHQIHENSFDLIWINKIFDEWLDINCI